MERRLAKNPPGSTSEIEPSELLSTLEEAQQSFKNNKRKSSTPKEQEENEIKRKSTTNHQPHKKTMQTKTLKNALSQTAHRTINKNPE